MENIKFGLREIATLQFAILPDAYDSSAEKFQYSFGINFSFPDIEKRMICCSCLVKYEGKISPFLILEVAVYFEVEEESWDQLKGTKTNQIKLPKGTAHHMMSLTIGSARGILHSETKNTEFNRLILPTVNLNKLIDADVIQSIA
ncbi:hypothetical protein [Algoriphagus antarcticus]|uniref:Uncharacterized protein n=1 Tax=Algoriphagus antarcticus TaxID=238540 RepID=A0A3E0D880_9BACT|nr:hypothetical protein [Algoriphagus antarcticus]REG78222.1 hypothetical protein C8N25_13914 [Algoriphagus antarcticus]